MIIDDTIAAVASPLAPSARIILRVSGAMSCTIAAQLTGATAFEPSPAQQVMLRFSQLAVPAWLYAFRSPRSYTGQDSIELHIPGSPVLARLLLDELYRLGARPAEPGEFTARAFFNGKIGLSQAEGVAATIAASNEAQLTAARQLMAGELTRRLTPITETVAQTLALIEVGIDFSEEEVTFLDVEEITQRIGDVDAALVDLLEQSGRFEQLTHEPRIVFAGRPNAGKSTLINALTGKARAVVSPIAGTTRDVLSAPCDLRSGRVLLMDVAGTEEVGDGDIDRQMQLQATRAITSADHLVLIQDCLDDQPPLELPRRPDLVVQSKSDLGTPAPDARSVLRISAKTGAGLDELRAALDALAFGRDTAGGTLALNRRHLQAIESARESLSRASARVTENATELVAMDLREALDALGSISGQITPDDILGRVFSSFCIGK